MLRNAGNSCQRACGSYHVDSEGLDNEPLCCWLYTFIQGESSKCAPAFMTKLGEWAMPLEVQVCVKKNDLRP